MRRRFAPNRRSARRSSEPRGRPVPTSTRTSGDGGLPDPGGPYSHSTGSVITAASIGTAKNPVDRYPWHRRGIAGTVTSGVARHVVLQESSRSL
jgi:hypothetical protein